MIGEIAEAHPTDAIGGERRRPVALYNVFGWAGVVWAAGAAIGYVIWLLNRPELSWNLPLKTGALLLSIPVLTTALAHLPSLRAHKLLALCGSTLVFALAAW